MTNHPTSELRRVPDVIFKIHTHGAVSENTCMDMAFAWSNRTSDDIFSGRKVVLFALPGAFTPTCSSTHAPGYDRTHHEFKELGIDEVICLSVNDPFVMSHWGKQLGIKHVTMLPDGNGDFTRAMGMLVKKENLGFGMRSWRYSMLVVDGVIEKMFVERGYTDNSEDDPFEVSDATTMLAYVKSKA